MFRGYKGKFIGMNLLDAGCAELNEALPQTVASFQ
jgi:hypothetical protein